MIYGLPQTLPTQPASVLALLLLALDWLRRCHQGPAWLAIALIGWFYSETYRQAPLRSGPAMNRQCGSDLPLGLTSLDFTNRLDQLDPKTRMMASWMVSSGMRLSFVIAMKSHLGILAMVRSIVQRKAIKGITTTEEEALFHVRENRPGLLILSDQLAEGDGFSLCRRSLQVVPDLRVLMVLTGDATEGNRALDSGAMAVVCEDDFLMPEMEVMQSLLAAANCKCYVSSRARARMKAPESILESPLSLTPREKDILVLLLKGLSDVEIADALAISTHTVKDYGKSIRSKYNVKTRIQLISALLGRAILKKG